MTMGRLGPALLFSLFVAGCDPVPMQYPPASAPYPPASPPVSPPIPSAAPSASPPPPAGYPQPQAKTSQRGQYVWERMMDGVAMGGSIAGPYGAAAGLLLGAFYGFATADAYYEQINAQIQSEQAKDKELEAQIEREIERQRELEAQLGQAPAPVETKNREAPQIAQRESQERKVETKPESKADSGKEALGPLASLPKKEISPRTTGSPFKNVEVRDINGDGIPDLWIYYNPLKPGEIIRQEEATNGDGKVNTWSYFKDGKLVRREVDAKGNGRPDIIYYYENDKLTREERDEHGDGQPSYRAIYQDGRLARVEKDLNHDGKMDLWIYYDTAKEGEVVLKEERDLNGDGAVDLWSYYEAGRLTRRDVSAAGLEILSKEEKIPTPPPDPQTIRQLGG
ncbi:MAG: FlxA-like family protein [Deltaproteobacteria bacterium]|nr:FlxA-like family protein [Deltaproteobacteria bacterium]